MSTAMPPVPPRPSRSQVQDQGATLGSDIPKIPPRPTRRLDRSQSPNRESFARSPLNEVPSFIAHKSQGSNLSSSTTPGPEPPARPPSVALPSIGQEGSEYGEVFGAPELGTSPTQTRNVANDLKLHAPKPSLPTLSAKQRVSAVTRTDSEQAASFGIGKAPGDDKDPAGRPLRAKASFASQTSNGTERPGSSHGGEEQGIPEIGQRVPMYPNAGDVQAPSPAPFATPYAPGIGFHNDGSKPRHHGRRTSGRGFEGPPGSYGLHGHGVVPNDRFEKAYYEKHPELFKKESGAYHGDGSRAEWAMSSDDLNKIVRDTASRGAGLGTSPALIGTPSEEVGFQATEEYASRMSSPKPQYQGHHSNPSQTHLDSPLRKASFPADTMGKAEFEGTLSRGLQAPSDHAMESEVEDEDTIHVDEPGRRSSKIYGTRFESTESLGVAGEEEEEEHEDRGYSAPILAEDEVAKEPFGYELQPAVSPYHERRRNSHDDGGYHHRSGSASSLTGSRPSSRPGSIHGGVLHDRDAHSTPLENLEEYEPLFPEDEKAQKPLTAADRLKRPELKNRKFPSQDVWEDAPNSLHYTATVSTPQLPEDIEDAPGAKSFHVREGETPEQAFARRQEEMAEEESKNSQSFLQQEKKPWAHKSHLTAETRPGMKQRFPSRDIWEDTPDSLQLQTTVGSPQSDEKDVLSPPEERPTTGAVVYHQEKAAAGHPLGGDEGRATTGIAATLKPDIPARPAKAKSVEGPAQPLIPNRPARKTVLPQVEAPQPPLATKPKPTVPARPSKISRGDSAEGVPLTQVASNSSANSVGSDSGAAAATKPKPPVPSRPVGSKIAALQGGFLSDLNKRLQLGPQAPKKEETAQEREEEVKEKAPLADARKGRARGPARRAPAKSPAPAVAEPEKTSSFGFSTPATVWHIHPDEGVLSVVSQHTDDTSVNKAEPAAVAGLATNTAGESLQNAAESSPMQEKSMPVPSEPENAAHLELADAPKDMSTDAKQTSHGSPVLAQHNDTREGIEEDDMATSTGTLKPDPEK